MFISLFFFSSKINKDEYTKKDNNTYCSPKQHWFDSSSHIVSYILYSDSNFGECIPSNK